MSVYGWQKRSFQPPPFSAQEDEKWTRLTYANTVSSAQKEAGCNNQAAPRDSLDLALETEYDQHREFLKDKNETLLQKETLQKASKWVEFSFDLIYTTVGITTAYKQQFKEDFFVF